MLPFFGCKPAQAGPASRLATNLKKKIHKMSCINCFC